MEEKFTFFWNGPFSQWAGSTFVVDDIAYNCTEQYMMAEKARVFGDKEAEKKIMASMVPWEHKTLGRGVRNFNVDKWNSVAKYIVFKGNMAKFTQDEKLKAILLDTAGTTLVEASPHDKIWGIGLDAGDKRAQSRSTWLGENWLGEVLTSVREEILKEK